MRNVEAAHGTRSSMFPPPGTGVLSTERLLQLRQHPMLGRLGHRLLRYLSGADVPSQVQIGSDVVLHHHAFGLVVHGGTRIGDRVHLFHNVTVGVGKDPLWEPPPDDAYEPIVIEDDAWLCAGATVLAGRSGLRIARGTIVGAGAVLRESTGPWEIWAGVPARRVGRRRPSIWIPPHARDSSGQAVIWLDEDEALRAG